MSVHWKAWTARLGTLLLIIALIMSLAPAMADTIEFERAVAAAVEWVEATAPDTLIVVTSDHAHSYDVFRTVDTELFNAATDDSELRNAIRIYADAGFPTYTDEDGDFFPDDWAPTIALAQGKVENPVFTEDYQVSEVYRTPSLVEEIGEGDDAVEVTMHNPEDDPNGLPLGGNLPEGSNSSVHTLQSVPVYAHGPGSECLGRIQENIEVFFCMAGALGLDPSRALLPNIVDTAISAGSFETLGGGTLRIGIAEDGTVTVNDAVVSAPDVKSANGVIHVIEAVLLPAAEQLGVRQLTG